MSRYIKILSGDCCVELVREIPVPVREVVRRVLVNIDIDAELGLIPVSGVRLARWPSIPPGVLPIPVSGVDDAESRFREQVGEETTGGKRQHGTFKRDMIRDGMILRHAQH